MARILETKRRKVAPKRCAKKGEARKVVLAGTYRAGQLGWIKEHGLYNYPAKAGDGFDAAAMGAVGELWLYADAKGTRHCFEAKFVGKMTRAEWLKANPSYQKKVKGREKVKGKGQGQEGNREYYVFQTKPLEYGTRFDGPHVIARVADFGGRSGKVRAAIKAYEKSGNFGDLADYLPTEIGQVPKGQLRVCEPWVQMDFMGQFEKERKCQELGVALNVAAEARADGKLTCVEICAGAGGQAIGLERAGFSHVALVEYESEYCDVLKHNNPAWNVVCADVRHFDGRPYQGVDLLAGGVPCPPFSVASKQLGKDDERDLFPEAIRLIGEIKPKAVMIENVRGLLDPKFDDYRKSILEKIDTLGYDTQIKLLHASDYGVPQIRPRVVIVGIRKDLKRMFAYPTPDERPAPTVGEALRDMMAVRGWRGANAWARRANSVAPTIVGGSKKHGGPDLGPTRARRAWAELGVDGLGIANEPPQSDFEGVPKLTKEMIAVIQGFPREWNFGKKKTAACRMIGNAFPPPVAEAVGMQIRRCLNNEK